MKLIEIGKFMVSKTIDIKGSSKNFGRRMLYFWWNYKPIFHIYLWKVRT